MKSHSDMNNVVNFPVSMYVHAVDHAVTTLANPLRSVQAERDIANLRTSYREHMDSGNQLVRMVRQCQERAGVCFATAERIKEQLTMYGVTP